MRFLSGAAAALATALLLAACSGSTDPIVDGGGSGDQVSDEFERTDLGANWVQVSGSGGGISAGNLSVVAVGGFLSMDWTGRFQADQFSEMVVAAGKDPNYLVQLHVRRQSSSPARYGFHYNPEKTPAVWELKYDGVPTAQTRIVASATGSGPVPGDVLRFEARGRVLSGYRNGQLIVTGTDNAADAILATGGTGITSRLMVGSTVARYPAPIAASWKGGSLR